jgi:hypothetical protein
MTSDVKEYQPMSTQELIRHIQRYQSDSAHARSVEVRWLCTILQPALDAACEVGNSRLSEQNRKDLNAFRAVELEKQIETKRKDMEALERDLKKVRAA